jgi:hypothetical protein
MKRFILFILLCSAMFQIRAQEEKPVTVVKPGTTEMKAADERPAGVIILSPATATGDFDVPPAHPECVEMEGQEMLDCTSKKILELVKQKTETPMLDMEQWGTSHVSINFSIDQFGGVKDTRVEHSTDKDLHKKVILGMYELPNFQPATKDGKSTGSSMQVNYRYEELFQ